MQYQSMPCTSTRSARAATLLVFTVYYIDLSLHMGVKYMFFSEEDTGTERGESSI